MALTQIAPSDWPALSIAPAVSVTSGDEHTLVQLDGEHDIATLFVLADALARAVALDDADVVVDLSHVKSWAPRR